METDDEKRRSFFLHLVFLMLLVDSCLQQFDIFHSVHPGLFYKSASACTAARQGAAALKCDSTVSPHLLARCVLVGGCGAPRGLGGAGGGGRGGGRVWGVGPYYLYFSISCDNMSKISSFIACGSEKQTFMKFISSVII